MDPVIRSELDTLHVQLDSDDLPSRNVLITGGAGFLGSWLCDVFVKAHAVVYCVDNLSTGLKENLVHLLGMKNFVFQELDVARPDLEDRRYDLILHFASRPSPGEYRQHPIETIAVNAEGTRNMLELARKTDARLLLASTSEVYGDAQIIPTPEAYWGNVNPLGPRSCYDESKRFAETLCIGYHRTYGLDVRIVRIFNTYGPRLRSDGLYGRALSRFIDQALSGRDITVYGRGEQTRSFCYVTDTVAAIVKAAASPRMKGEVVNIGNVYEVSILDLAERIQRITNSKSNIIFLPRPADDPQRRCPAISKAKQLLNWFPRVNFEDGLLRMITWFKERRPAKR